MRKVSLLAIDLAKKVFHLHGIDAEGNALLRKKLGRSAMIEFVTKLETCTIVMEACATAHFWGRSFRKMGHEVKLINPRFVKPFVKSNKNDSNDAEAISIAAIQKSMRFVEIKEQWQQEIQTLHRTREMLMKSRISFSNCLRGLMAEFGVALPEGGTSVGFIRKARAAFDDLSEAELALHGLQILLDQIVVLQEQLAELDKKIEKLARSREDCRRLQEIEGIGPLTATALVASTHANGFTNGRSFSASLGLVPRQNSSGGRNTLLGISKRGDSYLRKLLINGARSSIVNSKNATRRQEWAREKVLSRGMNKACVALANKNARVVWVLLARGENYKTAA